MTHAALAVVCGLGGLAVGPLYNVMVERVPLRRAPSADEEGDAAAETELLEQPRPVNPVVMSVLCGGLFAGTAIRFGADWAIPAYLVFFAALLSISVIDLQLQIIPNRIVYPAIFASVPLLAGAAALQSDWSPLGRALVSGAVSWLALLVVHLISPAGMGFGDVRLSFLLGLFLGWVSYGLALVGLFLGFLLGAVAGVVLVALRLRSRNDHVPFGPFLATGAALGIFFGGPLVKAWLG